jgi:hypothetical protein
MCFNNYRASLLPTPIDIDFGTSIAMFTLILYARML